jgi:post-segregation antitoxin (ccd killing protein)
MGANSRLKNREPFTTTVRPDLVEALRRLSDETRINMSRLVDEALEDLLKKYHQGEEEKDTPL